MTEPFGCRNATEKQRPDGEDEQSTAFLEEDLIRSLSHKDQCKPSFPIGSFEPALIFEGCSQNVSEVGPREKIVEEANQLLGPSLQDHQVLGAVASLYEVGLEEPACSGPELPPGFEKWIGTGGLRDTVNRHCGSLEYFKYTNALEEGIEEEQSIGESHGSFSNSIEKIPKTPLLESLSILNRDVNEDVILDEEDLVEAWVSWKVGKVLELKISNDKAMIDALAKVKECQDFVLPRKRGRPRKNKDRK